MHKTLLVALAALSIFVAGQAAAEPVNPMRERVRQWEIRMLENAIGKERAAEVLAAKPKPEIVGGNRAADGKWAWQVALLSANEPNNFVAQFCGGTLVDELFVVTAAHCITNNRGTVVGRSTIHVLTGTQSLTQNAPGGVPREVAQIVRHPSYNDAKADFDVAVIKLKTPATGIRTAKLLTRSQEATLAAAGDMSVVTGWGDLGNGSYPKELHEVRVPIVSLSLCKGSYGAEITGRMICAGFPQGGKDSCQGDSGGPLIVKGAQGWNVLAGIVSWGEGCALPDFFGVYSRVAVLSAWINQTIASMSADPAGVTESTSCSDLRGSSQSKCLDGLSLAPR